MANFFPGQAGKVEAEGVSFVEQQSLPSFGLGDVRGRGSRPFTSSTTSPGLREVQGGQLNMAAPHSPWGALKARVPD